MIEITDTHIAEFESRFERLSFDDESKEFIKCLETKDIQACPGAGKTTSLVAKLDIIASQMPFKDNSGILVLTHTNVAVDEIKAKLGANAKILLSYPNHVGTFQSFVNKYLAIPMYVKLRGNRPERIDTEIFYKMFQKKFDSVNEFHRNWLIERADEKYTNVLNFIENFEVNDTEIKYNGRNVITTNSQMFSAIKTISQLPINVMKSGYLKYDHCYDLAINYLDSFPNMKEVFQNRFKYVFVDEVQDTDDIQFEILDKLFSNSDVVIQRIGDKNQEIFRNIKSEASGWNMVSDNLEIKNTKRLSTKISEKVKYFAISPQELNGNSEIELQPVILLFDKNNMQETVLLEFGKLIDEYELYNVGNKIFKAVGAIKSHNDHYGISSYYTDFVQTDNTSLGKDTLLEKFELYDTQNVLVQDYRKVILAIVIEYLKAEKIFNDDKYFTITTLLKFLKENHNQIYNDFKLKLLKSVQKLNNQECSYDIQKEKIQNILNLFGKYIDEEKLKEVIKNYKFEFIQKINKNKFNYSNGEITFDIDISTIHKVKGETHTATLVLETFNRTYDLKQLLNLLKGKTVKSSTMVDSKKKLLYVAMSRPTHLLCFAINKEHLNDGDKSDLESCGYILKRV
ncbi:UvrD-helicase domain-containing protein [Aliarcobacter butzleri]|uniref:UvrD-helicase domain-containing protein n=1 Tax=Aliarcobacter butzleri TaxID=28197 RepID=UPI001EDA4E3F|nr:UvrD-helicase domain-containing protein [Aliarcobacter butzleri]MCG3692185.1 UvrD-helicase domain-containing protein [Aliarcobacter butzleri]